MKILRAGLDPRALERFLFPPYKIIDSLEETTVKITAVLDTPLFY
jgi:hypothetical protein